MQDNNYSESFSRNAITVIILVALLAVLILICNQKANSQTTDDYLNMPRIELLKQLRTITQENIQLQQDSISLTESLIETQTELQEIKNELIQVRMQLDAALQPQPIPEQWFHFMGAVGYGTGFHAETSLLLGGWYNTWVIGNFRYNFEDSKHNLSGYGGLSFFY